MNSGPQEHSEVGYVSEANNYLLSLEGFPSAHLNDVIETGDGSKALVASLERDYINALLLNHNLVKSGDRFTLNNEGLVFPLGDYLLGRVIDVLGHAIDGAGSMPRGGTRVEFDVVAPGIDTREEINNLLMTGVSVVDTLFPIGRGQRQLLFGPVSSGKTTFLRDLIVNQKGQDMICVYTAIGKPATFVERFARSVFEKGAGPYTVILSALAESPTPLNSIAPTIGFFVAEYFRNQGKHVVLILDDLGAHAKYMREIALLMGRIPGRQSYPGDIFYQHAHLLERAGNFNQSHGGGSVTVLPVLETDIENFTDLIPTNIMATTDGHIFFDPALRAEGIYPSIAINRSVTRVGHQTQRPIHRELSTKIMSLFAEYNRQQEYVQFGTNISSRTKNIIKQGDVAKELLKQRTFENMEEHIQIALLGLIFTPLITNRDVTFIKTSKHKMIEALKEDPKLEAVRMSAKQSGTISEFLEVLNKNAYLLEKACQA